MKVGDEVWWESQSAGSRRTKVGTIVGVVPAGGRPTEFWAVVGARPRDHESYVVRARYADQPGGRTRLYWPRKGLLRRVSVPRNGMK